jgi:hypothetical protein
MIRQMTGSDDFMSSDADPFPGRTKSFPDLLAKSGLTRSSSIVPQYDVEELTERDATLREIRSKFSNEESGHSPESDSEIGPVPKIDTGPPRGLILVKSSKSGTKSSKSNERTSQRSLAKPPIKFTRSSVANTSEDLKKAPVTESPKAKTARISSPSRRLKSLIDGSAILMKQREVNQKTREDAIMHEIQEKRPKLSKRTRILAERAEKRRSCLSLRAPVRKLEEDELPIVKVTPKKKRYFPDYLKEVIEFRQKNDVTIISKKTSARKH